MEASSTPRVVPEIVEKPRLPERETVIKAIEAIENGPQTLRVYMEICAKCGTCAEQCPTYYGSPEKSRNPAARSDLIRSIYRRRKTLGGKILGELTGAHEYTEGEISEWVKSFYECTACRRCATFCPFGIDNSVITRKGRAIIHSLGLTPQRLLDITDISLKSGNTDGCGKAGFVEAVKFLEEEIEDECGVRVSIPLDIEGADFLYVPPSGDVLVNPEATMAVAKIFHKLGISWTMSSSYFDGANYGLFTGDDKAMKEENKHYCDEAKRLRVKNMMCGECGHAYRVFKFMMEKGKWWGDLPFKVMNVLPFTASLIKDGAITLDKTKNPEPVTYHDPCNFGRSCNIVEEPREILRAACEDYRDMTPCGTENWCCGGGGGLAAMDDLREFRMTVSGKKKMEQIRDTGAKFVATACANCKRQITQLMEYHDMDVTVGGVHDLVYTSIVM